VSLKAATVFLVLLGAGQPPLAQAAHHSAQPVRDADLADGTTFETNVANLTARAAFSPSTSLSRQEYFSLMILMSLPRDATRNPIKGAKP
jgi:hypothetical protein